MRECKSTTPLRCSNTDDSKEEKGKSAHYLVGINVGAVLERFLPADDDTVVVGVQDAVWGGHAVRARLGHVDNLGRDAVRPLCPPEVRVK